MNFANLNDVEFEYLCKDIMSKKLGVELRRFPAGKDGGIDLTDDTVKKNIVVQVKHYGKTDFDGLFSSLKKELSKVEKINPKQYYVCCSKELTPGNVTSIYNLFSDYMDSTDNVISLIDISDFLALEENSEILHRHFKLWIESTNILHDVLSRDISIDCESLLYNIRYEENLFVQTTAFEQAKEILEKKRLLLLIGDPGVGKTMTSKMLALYFATKGYRIRHTTDGNDLSALKRALSESPDSKEVVLLDDCFGQAYYTMKDTQENELLSVIRHIHLSKNKLLIINSRITIYNEAQKRSIDFLKSVEKKEFEVSIINMTDMPLIEKAKILYNHLYFSGLSSEYFDRIKENKFYLKIIKHRNYNPRIIEFISAKYNAERIGSNRYRNFVRDCLNNPKDIWKNEFEQRLKPCDRFLVYTVYSLTNTTVPIEVVKSCYNSLIKDEPEIDTTIDCFEDSFSRLQDAFFFKLVDRCGNSEVSMLNPSINDFLDSYISATSIDRIITKAKSVRQFYRLMPEKAEDLISAVFQNNAICTFAFENNKQKNAYITAYVVKKQIMCEAYCSVVEGFLFDPTDANLYNKQKTYESSILQALISEPLCSYYNVIDQLKNMNCLSQIFDHLELPELVAFIAKLNPFFQESRSEYIALCQAAIKDALDFYCTDVPADNYDIDVNHIRQEIGYGDEFGWHVDPDCLTDAIESDIEATIKSEVSDFIATLPNDLIPEEIRKDMYHISVTGVSELVGAYDFDGYDDDERYFNTAESPESEIDYIFLR